MRLAVIDIGTNTILMLIAEVSSGQLPMILRDEHSIARLGKGVDKTRRISDAAYKRFAEIIRRYNALITECNVSRVIAFATSAMRDAENRDDIIRRTKDELRIDIEILSGDDEARWSFQGALFGIPSSELNGVIATLDIGGGSTEISVGENGIYKRGSSVDIGAVRIKERFLAHSSGQEIARSFIREQLPSIVPISPRSLIAVAGTPTSLAAMKHRLTHFDTNIVDGTIIHRDELQAMLEEMFSISAEELVRRYPAVSPARADILPAGALILDEAMLLLKLEEARVSTKGVRYGILLREIERM
ncbi:MAG TPA: hypothetical protein VEW28_02630 [Candidatus Kapabacteria bacterium]|nr:hypothetical protein [Candidatus Kapabacteria bacterium]